MEHADRHDFIRIFLGISPSEIDAGMEEGMASRLGTALFERAHIEDKIANDDCPNKRFLKYFKYAANFYFHLELDPSIMIPVSPGLSYHHPQYPRHMSVLCRNVSSYFQRSLDVSRTFDVDDAIKKGPHERFVSDITSAISFLSGLIPRSG